MTREKRADDLILFKLLEDLGHKSWSTRKQGYETFTTLFEQTDGKSANWNDVAQSLVGTVVAERNVPALEKGLASVLCYVRNVKILNDEIVSPILDGVVRRCLSYSKSRIRESIVQICCALVDKRKGDSVTAALLKNVGSTNRKQVLASVEIVTTLLRQYGPRIVNVPKFVPKIVDLCNDKNTYQQEVKDCLKQLYSDLGPSLRDYLIPLSASIKKTVDAELAKIDNVDSPSNVNPETSSSIKWMKKLKFRQTSVETTTISPNSAVRPFSSKIDEWKSAQTTKRRIKSARSTNDKDDDGKLSRNNRRGENLDDMMNMIQSDQWGERKTGLELIGAHLKTTNSFSALDTSKLIKILRNIILEDTNVLIVAKAVQCVTDLSNDKNDVFRQEAPLLMTLLLERFKEKKSVVVNALRDATDAIVSTADTQSIIRYIAHSLEHKNPTVKLETESLVQRCFLSPNPQLLKPSNWRPLVVNLIKNLANQDQSVREKAMAALGTIDKAVGGDAVAPFFENVLKHQLVVIEKYSQKADVNYRQTVGNNRDKESDDGNYSSEESLLPQRGSSDNSVVSKLEKITLFETGVASSELGRQSSELKGNSFVVDESSVLLPVSTTVFQKTTNPPSNERGFSKRSVSAKTVDITTVRRPRPLSSSDRDKLSTLRFKIQTLREMWSEMHQPLTNTM